MDEATHVALRVLSQGALLEATDADHLFKKADLVLLTEFLVDRRLGIVFDRFGFDGISHKQECDGKNFRGRI
jgi:hypothetical protein